jgi:hypothetical protein
MADEHLHPHRGWALIRDDGRLTPEEIEHLQKCTQCHSWLTKFTSLARESGFKITFKIPDPTPPKKNGGTGSTNQGSEVA